MPRFGLSPPRLLPGSLNQLDYLAATQLKKQNKTKPSNNQKHSCSCQDTKRKIADNDEGWGERGAAAVKTTVPATEDRGPGPRAPSASAAPAGPAALATLDFKAGKTFLEPLPLQLLPLALSYHRVTPSPRGMGAEVRTEGGSHTSGILNEAQPSGDQGTAVTVQPGH